MHVITKRTITEFSRKHPQSITALGNWYQRMNRSRPESVNDIKRMFKGADYVGNDRFVFNICGNKYRLIALIIFCKQKVFIRFIGTHAEYNKINSRIISSVNIYSPFCI